MSLQIKTDGLLLMGKAVDYLKKLMLSQWIKTDG